MQINNHFIAHVIRDTFVEKNFTVIYGNDTTLRDTLLLPEHSIGAFQMHSDQGSEIKYDNCEFWNIGLDNPHISYGDVDLFISINYNPELQSINKDKIATQIKNLLKPKAKILLVNPGNWADNIKQFLCIDLYSTTNVKRYSMFKDQDVVVYENI